MDVKNSKEILANFISSKFDKSFIYKKNENKFIKNENNREISINIPITYWKKNELSFEAFINIKFKNIEKETIFYTSNEFYVCETTVGENLYRLYSDNDSNFFHDESELLIKGQKL